MNNQQTWMIDGVHFHAPDIKNRKTFWALEARKLITATKIHRLNIENTLKEPGLLKLTRERLKTYSRNIEQQLQMYENFLKPLDWHRVNDQAFASYLQSSPFVSVLADNLFYLSRDWGWGEKENKIAVETIRQQLSSYSPHELLVLGAGAGRLSFDLATQGSLSQVHLVDANPFLILAAKKIIQGEPLPWVDFPLVPRQANEYAVSLNLQVPKTLEGVNWKFSCMDLRESYNQLPQTDCVLTPWLMDVMEWSLPAFLKMVHDCLKPDGHWILFGPLGFNRLDLKHYHSYEEVLHWIEKAGFTILNHSYEMLPYMQSPHSNSHRFERVLTLVARKKSNDWDWETDLNSEEPTWLQDPDTAIHLPVRAMALSQGHALNQQICLWIEEGLSFNVLKDRVIGHFHFSPEEAHHIVLSLLQQIDQIAHQNPLGSQGR